MSAPARLLAVAALAGAVVTLALVLAGGGSPYDLHLRMQNASLLVKGDPLEVGGLAIGTVTDLQLTSDNQADVTVRIDDDRFKPVHAGTTAYVRIPSLSGVANRYVELQPGPNSAARLPEGAVIAAHDTQSAVDIDALQSTLDADTRARLQSLIHGGSAIYADGGSRDFNRALEYLDPALAQTQATLGQLVADRAALERFIVASSVVVRTVAAHAGDVEHGLASTATTASALDGQSRALRDLLRRAPGSLRVATSTLQQLATTLDHVTPTARAGLPAAPKLSGLLRGATPALQRGASVLPRLRRLLPELGVVMRGLPALRSSAVPALTAATSAVRAAQPIVDGTLPYFPDVWLGATNGFGGTASGYYDANGEYGRIAFVGGPYSVSGVGSLVPVPSSGTRFGNWERCPGAATQVAQDGSNKIDVPGCKEAERP